MRRLLTPLIGLSLCLVSAQENWTVPSQPAPLAIEVEGTVEINRASVQTIRTGSEDAIVAWIGPDGKHAAFGDVLMRLDTERLKRRYEAKHDRLIIKRSQSTNEIITLVRTLATAEEDLAVKVADLRVRAAEARSAGRADTNKVATLIREMDLAERQATLQEADLSRMKNLFKLGELSRVEIEDAELAAATAQRNVILSQLTLEDAGDGSDPVLARRAEWQVERALATLGVDKNGEIIEDKGYGKKIIALRKKLERSRKAVAAELAAEEIELQTVARAAWPHIPIREFRILQDGQVLHHFIATNPSSRAVYSPAREFGWVKAPLTAPSDEALVIRGTARWRMDLPPGTYQTEWQLGDKVEWGCMSVKAERQILIADNRLAAKERKSYEAELVVGDTGLLLDFGREDKAILASSAGAVKNQSWLSLGREIRSNVPALYLTPSAQLVVNLLVHHLQIPFFETNQAVVARIELQTSQGAWIPAGAVKMNEDPVRFYPSPESHRGAPDESNPQEKTAREVQVQVPSEHAHKFAFAAHVVCRVTAEAKAGTVMLPAYLVQQSKDGLFVMRGETRQAIRATRYDQVYLVNEGVQSGDVLQPPPTVRAGEGGNRFTGEVVAGDAIPITVGVDSWARIEDLLPHGSKVKKGDLVMTLYRPEENAHSYRARAKAGKAEAGFLSALDAQQAEFLRETGAQAQALQEEKLAADRVSENRRIDLSVLAGADESERAAAEELAVLETRVAQLEGKDAARLQYEDYRRQRDILRLQAKLQAINKIETFRQTEYTTALSDRFNWLRSRTELQVREGKMSLMIKQQDVMSQKALTQLQDGVEDLSDSYDFETQRFLKSPGDGSVFWNNGYNDMIKRRERVDKEFVVWEGLMVGEVLDVDNMLFKVHLPERYFKEVEVGTALPIELEDLGDRQLRGQVATKGQSLSAPQNTGETAPQAIGLHQAFEITLSFAVPPDLKEFLRPGLRGAVTLP